MSKIIFAVLSLVILSGCAGVSEQHKAENKALREMQKADAVVKRKEVKLALSTAASVAATNNMFKSANELRDAKKEKVIAKENLCKTFELCE